MENRQTIIEATKTAAQQYQYTQAALSQAILKETASAQSNLSVALSARQKPSQAYTVLALLLGFLIALGVGYYETTKTDQLPCKPLLGDGVHQPIIGDNKCQAGKAQS